MKIPQKSDPKILLCNGAYIGDLILSTALLPVIKNAYPTAKIGFLIGSWALPVIQNHTHVDWIHTFDHPKLNRALISPKAKRKRGHRMWLETSKEVAKKEYDLAIDLYHFYPANSGSLLSRSKIPTRVCFWGMPGHYRFTDRIYWNHHRLHMIENHRMMLQSLGIEEVHLRHFKMTLSYKDQVDFSHPEPYIVIHPGVGVWRRQWPAGHWQQLLKQLERLEYPLVFLGHGEKERDFISQITQNLDKPTILCDQLKWRELIPLIKRAKLLIGLESMSGHLAAAVKTPAISIYGRPEAVPYWRPYGPTSHVITTSDDFFPQEYTPFDAIKKISPDQVFQKTQELLSLQSS